MLACKSVQLGVVDRIEQSYADIAASDASGIHLLWADLFAFHEGFDAEGLFALLEQKRHGAVFQDLYGFYAKLEVDFEDECVFQIDLL